MVRIPVIVEPVDVPVPLVAIPVEVQDVAVTVRVALESYNMPSVSLLLDCS